MYVYVYIFWLNSIFIYNNNLDKLSKTFWLYKLSHEKFNNKIFYTKFFVLDRLPETIKIMVLLIRNIAAAAKYNERTERIFKNLIIL